MPEPTPPSKALLQEITWKDRQPVPGERKVEVQFNPETLKVSYAVQKAGGDQRGGGSTQFLGNGTTKLSFDLVFDVSVHRGEVRDVRQLTKEIADFMAPKTGETEDAPTGVRFLWGTFLFEGVMDSLNESLELFSEDGRPLRASVSVSLSRQDVYFKLGQEKKSNAPAKVSPGTRPLEQVRRGDTVQDLAARSGRPEDWPAIARANGIENPRLPRVGDFVGVRTAIRRALG